MHTSCPVGHTPAPVGGAALRAPLSLRGSMAAVRRWWFAGVLGLAESLGFLRACHVTLALEAWQSDCSCLGGTTLRNHAGRIEWRQFGHCCHSGRRWCRSAMNLKRSVAFRTSNSGSPPEAAISYAFYLRTYRAQFLCISQPVSRNANLTSFMN